MILYWVAKAVAKSISWLFFPVKVHGNVNTLPDNSGAVLCSNHVSFMDAVMLVMIFRRQICFVAKDKYAQKPILKLIFKLIGAFGINTDKPDFVAIKKCIAVPSSGDVLGIFPEGTRIINGKVSTPMPGVIMIANKAKSPLIYVRIKPQYGKFRLFATTDIYIGGCISVQELGVVDGKGAEYKEASAKLMQIIYGLGE